RADLFSVGALGTERDTGRLLQQHRSRGALGDEGERAVGVRGDDHRRRQARLQLGGRGVERLAELHAVQAALAEGRTDRRRGIRRTGLDLQFDVTNYLLCHFTAPASANACRSCDDGRLLAIDAGRTTRPADSLPSGLLDLGKFQLDRGRTTEDEHCNTQAALLVIDFLDHAVEVVERTVDNADHLAGLEQDLRTGLLDAFLDAIQDGSGLVVGDRQRAVSGTTDETHHLRGFLDQVPALAVDTRDAAFVVGLDLHQHVAGKELALGTALLAGAHFHDLF